MGSLCDQCTGLCCRYFALEIDKPKTPRQYDDIRWYLLHENIFIFIEEGKWYLGVMNKCKHLRADNRCGIYQKRPKICREYTTEGCDYHSGAYDFEHMFATAEQFEAFTKEKMAERRRRKRRAALRAAGKKVKITRKRKSPRRPVEPIMMLPFGTPRGNGRMTLPVLPGKPNAK